ncbi:heat shock factor 2-binding protein-like isoform X1 [Branchiostoma floridae x Branchiostoma belcheri]
MASIGGNSEKVTKPSFSQGEHTDLVTIKRADLQKLSAEVRRMKEFLPKVLNSELLQSYSRIDKLQQELSDERGHTDQLQRDADHWKSRFQASQSEREREKQELSSLKLELGELKKTLSVQTGYSASVGAASCTLLWRVSRSPESVDAMLKGSMVSEFLQLVGQTVQSYVTDCREREPPEEDSQEVLFVLALAGTVTNIAASAYGRDFLMSSPAGRSVVDVLVSCLSEAPIGTCDQLRNLVLMALYNLSINQKGLQYLSTRQGIIGLLAWLVQEEVVSENRLHCVRLLQSLIEEPTTPALLQEATQTISVELLQQLVNDRNPELQAAAAELMEEVQSLRQEFPLDI